MGYTEGFPSGVIVGELNQTMQATKAANKPLQTKILAGEYGLAISYWALYFFGAGLFALFGSRAVDAERWSLYLVMAAAMMCYTVILIIGVKATYKGPQLWKVMSRTSSVFMIINILVGISTLGFIY